MSEATSSRFSCEGCGRSYGWKSELAGKRVKCKCGTVMTVPQSPSNGDVESLYDLAPSEESTKPKTAARVPLAPRVPLTPKAPASGAAPARAATVAGATRRPAAAAAGIPRGAAPLGYQRGPAAAANARTADSSVFIDMNRDAYVPAALMVFGMLIYVAYYALHYQLGAVGIGMVTLGLSIMMVIKAGLLVGFALMVAGPAGVSFGGIYTAILKLAAIAVFFDGLATWVDYGMVKLAGPGGSIYGGMFGFFLAIGIYWVLMTYLFSMDPGDSWMVVCLLAVFNGIVRWALLILLLGVILSWGGVSGVVAPIALGGGGGLGGGSGTSTISQDVAELKELKRLVEARELIATGRQGILTPYVDRWYEAGAKNVWFEVDRDINGRATPIELIVEMPPAKNKEARMKCLEARRDYYKGVQIPVDEEDMEDDGERYMLVTLPNEF